MHVAFDIERMTEPCRAAPTLCFLAYEKSSSSMAAFGTDIHAVGDACPRAAYDTGQRKFTETGCAMSDPSGQFGVRGGERSLSGNVKFAISTEPCRAS
jgi:hypothetical protein